MAIITAPIVNKRYEAFKEDLLRNKNRVQNAIARMAAGAIESDEILALYRQLGQWRTSLQDVSAITGLNDYAQTAEGNPTYDVVSEIGATVTAITNSIAWVDSNYPASGGYLLTLSIDDGDITFRTFGSAGTAGFRTQLQTIVDSIG